MRYIVILLFAIGCGSSPHDQRVPVKPRVHAKKRAQAKKSGPAAPVDAESPQREPLSEREVLRALYPLMDADRRLADPEHPEHAIGTVTIGEFGDTDHACLVTHVRSQTTSLEMEPDQAREIEGTAEIIYDIAILRMRAGEVSVRARTREIFSISAPEIGNVVEARAAVELEAIWVISERDDAILIHASGTASSKSIGGNEQSGEFDYTESGGRHQYVLYRLAGKKLESILTVQVESATMVDANAPSAEDGQTAIEGEAGLEILDTETRGYVDVEVRTRLTRTEGVADPEVNELVERYVWDGSRYVRAGP